ncbi:MAG: 4Fe-4S dicluster domain-containing protein, partial [Verrucomicrobia bacterium]|nr:4Fe-4S dicluster domain-containing protein [Verrucomicrobiota bacterium]
RRPESLLEPFAQQPEGYVHGQAQHFATAMPTRGGAVPLVVKAHDGRPVKVEGNPLHPDSNGGTDRYVQASILDLYDPDRARRFTRAGNSVSAAEAMDFLTGLGRRFGENKGEGLAVLMEPGTSPSRERLQSQLRARMPKCRWFVHDPVGHGIHRLAASEVFGQPVQPRYRFDRAKVIVSLDCDFIGSEEDTAENIRRFADGRRVEKAGDSMSRLYVVESLMTLTGANADHRLRLPSSAVLGVAKALAKAAGVSVADTAVAGVDPKWILECARDLQAHKGHVLVVAGVGQPLAVHALAHAINSVLGSLGTTVEYRSAAPDGAGSIEELATMLNAGSVDTLVLLGGNPAYTAPVQLKWKETQRKAKTVVRLGYQEDETSEGADWNLPLTHYLETWGDARTSDGTLVPIQPLIAPLFGAISELDVLARLAGLGAASAYEVVRETIAGLGKGSDAEGAWRKFLHDGFYAGTAAPPVAVKLDASKVSSLAATAPASTAGEGNLEVVFRRDYSVDDGRYNNNGWLQELPDPITKLTWDNAVLVSRKTAKALNCRNNDVVAIQVGDFSVEGPIWVQPGQADHVLGLALGYGRSKPGRVGKGTGFDAYAIRTTSGAHIALGAKVAPTGRTYPLSCPQEHWSMEGRPIIREANLEQFEKHPDFARLMNMHEPPKPEGAEAWPVSLYPNPLHVAEKDALHQWGMSVDLNACVGCSTCVVACQSENNIPIVGKDQVARGREMQWLRLDRYYATDRDQFMSRNDDRSILNKAILAPASEQQFEEWIDDVQVVTQPMMCQHCENAPCESVCPVNATVHDKEGLNVMVYNRCVGTRYCSNNCPYKVRRFNFFDYNKRPLDQLYKGPLATRPADEWELIKMVKNPEVTVRMRGVMEKCTFCLQRIESARIAQKVKAGASGDVVVPDGTIQTACQQACPAGAIVFGNVADPHSRVSRLKQQSRDYSALEFLLTKPRLTYLAKLRNPNPAMPDYRQSPLSLEEYESRLGHDPFQSHGGGHGPADAAHGAEEGGHH